MFTRTLYTAQVLTLLFSTLTLFASTPTEAQHYHRPIHQVQQLNNLLDSTTDHLQVNIRQQDKDNMKFHIAISNPVARFATITIQRQDDTIFTETVSKELYENIYDLTQLEDGHYLIIVTSGKERICRNINIRTETHIDRSAQMN